MIDKNSKSSDLKNTSENADLNNYSTKPFFIPNDDSIRLETSLKNRVKVLLHRIGRSQNWLADEVGISRATMSHIVNGRWFPSSDIMIRICKVLECESAALFGDNKFWKIWSDKMIYPKEEKNGHKTE